MNKIPSFMIDHNKMLRGVYLSRIDKVGGGQVSTFDIRIKEPNREPVMDIPALHTIEHLGATFLRNHKEWGDKVVYFGPMGCRTGCYLLLNGDLESKDVLPLVTEMFEFMADFEGDIPGAAAKDCGNYLDHNLNMTHWESKKFLDEVLHRATEENLVYPS